MVARPPVRLVIEPMRLEDLPAVHAIEQASFTSPWPPHAYRSELESNRLAHYLVARAGDTVAAYGGMWLMVDEAHITTFAVHPAWRRQRIGERLLLAFLDIAVERDAHEATLEVRLSNLPARKLYEKYGFRPVGLRPRYYSDDHEDALIMTTEPLAEPAMRERIERLRAALDAAPAPTDPDARIGRPEPPTRAQGERPAPPVDRVVVRRDRDRPHRGRPADPHQRRRVAGRAARADGRDRPGGRGPGPPALDRPDARRGVGGAGVAWDDIDGVAVTYGPGLAGSLLVGINFAKALAWVHDKPLIGVNHLEGHVYAAWLLDPGEDEAAKPEPSFPLVALVVSGGHTFLAEMRDHLTYRLLGTTVDDAAGEAFDKVGRLLGLGYPGGPAIQKAAEGAVRRDVVFPRAWMGDSYDFSFSGLKTAARRVVADARAAEGSPADDPSRHALRRRRPPSWRGASRTRSSTCSRRRRPGPREAVGARSIVLGGGVAANSGLRERLRRGRRRWASRSSSRGPACAPTTGR